MDTKMDELFNLCNTGKRLATTLRTCFPAKPAVNSQSNRRSKDSETTTTTSRMCQKNLIYIKRVSLMDRFEFYRCNNCGFAENISCL